MLSDTTTFVISCLAIYRFTNHPSVFINSTSVPKFKAMLLPYVYISLTTAFTIYSLLPSRLVCIILTTESAVNKPDDLCPTDR